MGTGHAKQALIILAVGWLIGFGLMVFGGRALWFGTAAGTGIADLTAAGFTALSLALAGLAVGVAASALAIVLSSGAAASR